MNYAKDLHRKGELNKVAAMMNLADEMVFKKDMGTAFITESYYGFDAVCLIANKQEFLPNEGYVLYDEELNKPVFIQDKEE